MADLIYVGNDDRISNILVPYFADLRKSTGELNTLTVVKDEKALDEAMVAMAFEVIFFEQKGLPTGPIEYSDRFRGKYPGFRGKMILTGDDIDHVKLLKILESGWTDYILMPPDRPLLIEKAILYAEGNRTLDRQVYTLTMAQPADIARPAIMEELSEFGCKMKSSFTAQIGDMVLIYSEGIGDGKNSGTAVGRCYRAEPHSRAKGMYLTCFYFVGVKPELLQNIRKNLRKAYVSSKKHHGR